MDKKRWIIVIIAMSCAVAVIVWIAVQASSQTQRTAETGPVVQSTTSADPSPGIPAKSTAAKEKKPAPEKTQHKESGPKKPHGSVENSNDKKAAQKKGVTPKTGNDAALAAIPQPIAKPVKLNKPSYLEPGLSVSVSDFRAVNGVAKGIGEIAGPAISFKVVIKNRTDKAISTSNALVNVTYGRAKVPAIQLSGPGAAAFPEMVKAGLSASATLVFSVPSKERANVRVLFNYEASSPIAAFEGAAPEPKGKP